MERKIIMAAIVMLVLVWVDKVNTQVFSKREHITLSLSLIYMKVVVLHQLVQFQQLAKICLGQKAAQQ